MREPTDDLTPIETKFLTFARNQAYFSGKDLSPEKAAARDHLQFVLENEWLTLNLAGKCILPHFR